MDKEFIIKKVLLISLLLIVGCAKPINENSLVDRNGVKYQQDSQKPYSGKVWALLLILIPLFTLLLYSPVIKQMLFESQNYYSTTNPYANRLEIFTLFFPKLINKVFEGNLLIFAPFIILGIFFGKTGGEFFGL